MAYARTTLSAAVTLTDTSIVVASATSFAAGNRVVVDQEEMTIAKGYTSGTTIPVLRGVVGTATAAHASGAGVLQGIGAADFADPSNQQQTVSRPREVNLEKALDVTATGATGSTATLLTQFTPCIVTVTGASGAGVNIPTGAAMPGARYLIKNCMTGALAIYAVGSTLNGTTGTTAVSLTATGNLGIHVVCTEAGVWQTFGNT